MKWSLRLVWIALPALLALAPGVSAQTPDSPPSLSETLSGEARSNYEAARILFGDNDYAGASVKFQRAFDESGDVRLLWNVAVCEKNLRHYVKVLRLLERYQRDGTADMAPAHRSEVADVLNTVRQLISTVQLQVTPDGASVFVDEVKLAETPLAEPLLVDLGVRRIRVSKPGFHEQVITQNFAGGSELTLSVELKPEVHVGRLSITAASGDAISVDGQHVGQTQWQGPLPSGEHMVRVSAPGKRPYERELLVEDDQTRSLYVTLETQPSGISPVLWVSAGVLVAGGLATGAYLLMKPSPAPQYNIGTWGTLDLP